MWWSARLIAECHSRRREPCLVHSDSAGQTASNWSLFGVASCGSALATVFAEDVLRELLILALLAA
jgi:hypothetical protein